MSEVVVGIKLTADGKGLVGTVNASEKSFAELKGTAAGVAKEMDAAGTKAKTAAKDGVSAAAEMNKAFSNAKATAASYSNLSLQPIAQGWTTARAAAAAYGGDLDAIKRKASEAGQHSENAGNQAKRGGDATSSAWGNAKAAAIAYIAGVSLKAMVLEFLQIADALTLVTARLRLATSSAAEFQSIQVGLYSTAQRLGVSYEELARATARMAEPVKAMGGTAREAAKLSEILMTTARIQGATTTEATSSAQQFAQALGSGTLAGEELKAILENNNELSGFLAKGLGKTTGELKKMGEEGKLTGDLIGNALLGQFSAVVAKGKLIPETFEQGMERLKNASGQSISAFNDQYKITETLSRALTITAQAADDFTAAAKKAAGTSPITSDTTENALLLAKGVAFLKGAVLELAVGFETVGKAIAVAALGGKAFLQALSLDGKGAVATGKAMVEGWKDVGKAADKLGQIEEQLKAVETAMANVAKKTNKTEEETKRLAKTSEAQIAAADTATKGIKTALGVQKEYNDAKKAEQTRIEGIIAAQVRENKSAQDIALQLETSAQRMKGLDAQRLADIKSLGAADQQRLEQKLNGYKRETDAANAATAFLAKLREDQRKDDASFQDFLVASGAQSSERALAAKAAIDARGYADRLNLLKTALAEEQKYAEEVAKSGLSKDKKADKLYEAAEKIRKIKQEEILLLADEERAIEKNYEASELQAKSRAAGAEALKRQTDDAITGYEAQAEAQQYELSLMGKTASEIAVLNEQRRIGLTIKQEELKLDRAIADWVQSDATDEMLDDILAKHESIIDVLNLQLEIMPKIAGATVTAKEDAQKWLDVYKTIEGVFQSTFIAVVSGAKSGKDAIKDLTRTIKEELIKALYETTVKKWVVNFVANIAGGSTGQTLVNSASQSSGMLSQMASMFGGASSTMGSALGSLSTTLASAGPMIAGAVAASLIASKLSSAIGGALGMTPNQQKAASKWGYLGLIPGLIGGALTRPGGDKDGGSYTASYNGSGAFSSQGTNRFYTPSGLDATFQKLTSTIATEFYSALQRFGAKVGSASFGIGGDIDPKGTAQSRVSAIATVNGQTVYSNTGRNIGRDSSTYAADYDLEAKRAIAAALKAALGDSATVAKPLKDLFASFKIEGATLAQLDELLAGAEKINDIMAILADTKIKGLDYDTLKLFQTAGEELAATMARVSGAFSAYEQLFVPSAERQQRATDALRKTLDGLGTTLPTTRDGYRNLVDGLDISNESQRKLWQALLDGAKAADEYYKTIEAGGAAAGTSAVAMVKLLLDGVDEMANAQSLLAKYNITSRDSLLEYASSIDLTTAEGAKSTGVLSELAKAFGFVQNAATDAANSMRSAWANVLNSTGRDGNAFTLGGLASDFRGANQWSSGLSDGALVEALRTITAADFAAYSTSSQALIASILQLANTMAGGNGSTGGSPSASFGITPDNQRAEAERQRAEAAQALVSLIQAARDAQASALESLKTDAQRLVEAQALVAGRTREQIIAMIAALDPLTEAGRTAAAGLTPLISAFNIVEQAANAAAAAQAAATQQARDAQASALESLKTDAQRLTEAQALVAGRTRDQIIAMIAAIDPLTEAGRAAAAGLTPLLSAFALVEQTANAAAAALAAATQQARDAQASALESLKTDAQRLVEAQALVAGRTRDQIIAMIAAIDPLTEAGRAAAAGLTPLISAFNIVEQAANAAAAAQTAATAQARDAQKSALDSLKTDAQRLTEAQALVAGRTREQIIRIIAVLDPTSDAGRTAAAGLGQLLSALDVVEQNSRTVAERLRANSEAILRARIEASQKERTVVEQMLASLTQGIDALSALRSNVGDSMLSVRQRNPNFDNVGYYGGQLSSLGNQFKLEQSNVLKAQLGEKYRTTAIQLLDAQTAKLQQQHDSRLKQIATERDAATKGAQAQIAASNAAAQAAQQAAEALNGVRIQLKAYAQSLVLSDKSPLTAAQRLAEATGQYRSVATAADSNDVSALGKLSGVSDNLLKEAESYYGRASAEYGALFNEILQRASAQGAQAVDPLSIAREQLSTAQESLALAEITSQFDAQQAAIEAQFALDQRTLEEATIGQLQALGVQTQIAEDLATVQRAQSQTTLDSIDARLATQTASLEAIAKNSAETALTNQDVVAAVLLVRDEQQTTTAVQQRQISRLEAALEALSP